MRKFYPFLILIFCITAISACKKDKAPVVPQNKAIGTWFADNSINIFSIGEISEHADTAASLDQYTYKLNSDGTGIITIRGLKYSTFSYTIADSKVSYTNPVYYNLDGSVAGTETPFFESITTLTDTKLVTSLEQNSIDNLGVNHKSKTIISFHRIN